MFEAGRREAHFRKHIFKDGLGQKVFGILSTDRACPEAQLFDRIMLAETDPRYVPGQSLKPDLLRPLYKDKATGQMRTPTVEEVEAMITAVKSGIVNAPKIMARGDIEALGNQNPNVIVAGTARYIVANNGSAIVAEFVAVAPHCDVLMKWKNAGKAPELLEYLKQFKG